MGRGSTQQQRKLFSIKLQTKWKDETGKEYINPKFVFSKKSDNGDFVVDGQPEVEFSGYLLAINHGGYQWENRPIKNIIVSLVDGQGEEQTIYKLEMSLDSNLARGLVNKILSRSEYGFIVIRTYLKKDKLTKKEFPQLYIENQGEAVGWLYDYETQLKGMIEYYPDPKNPDGPKVPNYRRINDLFWEKWLAHEKIVRANAEKQGLITKPVPPPPPAPMAPKPKEDPAMKAAQEVAHGITPEDLGFHPDGPQEDVGDEPLGHGPTDDTSDLPF